jgi:hypothetical protein
MQPAERSRVEMILWTRLRYGGGFPMPNEWLILRQSRLRAAFGLANAALFVLLSGTAQAQFTRSRPHPSAPSNTRGHAETHSSDSEQGATVTRGHRVTGTDSTKTDTTSLDRYKKSQEASTVSNASNSASGNASSFIVWPYDYLSPFYGYGPGAILWLPREVYGGTLDSVVYLPGSVPPVILGWPNYDTNGPLTRDDTGRRYRIGEKTKQRRPVDIQPALDDIERAFQEEKMSLLASHVLRQERVVVSLAGEKPHLIDGNAFLQRLAAVVSAHRTIQMEFDSPEMLDRDFFTVTAWYSYRDQAAMPYRVKIRFVLQAQDKRLILTRFEMD